MTNSTVRFALVSVLSLSLSLPALPVLADPPSHAPAHGWRKKHDPYYEGYQGYGGRHWERDYGVLEGRCSAEAVGAVVGGVIGGAVGSGIGEGDGRRIATVLGTVIGAVVGAQVARDITDLDRACIGHALELSQDRHRVVWTNPTTHLHYTLIPVRSFRADGLPCREFDLVTGEQRVRRAACHVGDGRWQMRR
ncbi:glycine zipper 2TM domain-containing protein [Nitrogeniibacter mangrovi]|uniref:Glycine zipper 2TM domain-containing protein n=1 Tax=Nitrogeniibacter mangrovi TaxID=2016596 RepID=A0A6C1AYU7_9RHOO|nr:glycine zipper 2TM domain-containing protein [Nitrogeniibacter mangrovi]QID16526.1 glycine zipper 2TM domain-containing protein [Nitrogeniibacter mangrovi]